MGTIDCNGTTIGFGAEGHGEPFLLFHGTTMARGAWDFVRAAVPSSYAWVMPEFPGSGESAMPDGPLEVAALAEQGVAVMDALGHKQFHVAGYSLGAVVAAATAALHGERVRSATLLCGWAVTDGRMRWTFDLWRRLIASDPELFIRYAFADGLTHAGIEALEPMLEAMVPMAVSTIAPGSAAHLELDGRVDISALLGLITAPTLVIGGADDRWVDISHSRALADAIKGARLVELPAGHLVIQELAGEVAELMDQHASAV